MPRKMVECKAGLSQNLLQPRHGQHSNVIPPKSPHTSQIAKNKAIKFLRPPSFASASFLGRLVANFLAESCSSSSNPTCAKRARTQIISQDECKANPGRTGGANFEVMVTSTSTWPSQNQAVRSQKNNVEMLDQGA